MPSRLKLMWYLIGRICMYKASSSVLPVFTIDIWTLMSDKLQPHSGSVHRMTAEPLWRGQGASLNGGKAEQGHL